MENRIFVLTNSVSFAGFSKDLRDPIKKMGSYPDYQQPYVYFDESERTLKVTEDMHKSGLYLVYDYAYEDTEEGARKLKEQIENVQGEIFVLTHNKGITREHEIFSGKGNLNLFYSWHENLSNSLYFNLFKILCDDKQNKVERILLSVFNQSLELVLQILHTCLVLSLKQEENKDVRSEEKTYEELKGKLLGVLPDKVRQKLECFPDENTSLEELRDVLLEFALTQN